MKIRCLFQFIFFCIFLIGNSLLFPHNINDYINLYLPGTDQSSCVAPTVDIYCDVINEFIQASEVILAQDHLWRAKRTLRGCDIGLDRFQSAESYSGYNCPFIQKQCMAIRYKASLIGDLHGDVNALAKILKRMVNGDSEGKGKILNPDFSVMDPTTLIIFLGDYVDRGPSSLDTLFLLSLFKKQNPVNVFLLRGNHEFLPLNVWGSFCLKSELDRKFSNIDEKNRLLTKILQMYEYMPISLFLISGNSLIQCCHGGINPHFLPAKFLIDPSVTFDSLSQVSLSSWLGLLWSDFCSGDSLSGEPLPNIDRGVAFVYDVSATYGYFDFLNLEFEALDSQIKIKMIVRGHQHNFFPLKLMRDDFDSLDSGLKNWKEVVGDSSSFNPAQFMPVLTLSSSSVCHLNCQYSYCVLDADGDYQNWTLTPVEG